MVFTAASGFSSASHELSGAVQIVLVDLNPRMVAAWREAFRDEPAVRVEQGSLLHCSTDAWVSPTNTRARMDGGVDGAVRAQLGRRIERRVHEELRAKYDGELPIGHATCVPTGRASPAYLISTPTMFDASEDVRATMNTACACAAAFQAVHQQNRAARGSVRSVALPGLGAGTGRVPVELCAELMWVGYDLFREQVFDDFAAVRAALEERLGDLGPAVRVQAAWRARRASLAAQASGYAVAGAGA